MKLSEIMRMVFEADQERLKAEHLAAVSKTRDALIARGIRIRRYGKIEMRMPKRANSDPIMDAIYCTDRATRPMPGTCFRLRMKRRGNGLEYGRGDLRRARGRLQRRHNGSGSGVRFSAGVGR